MIEMTTRRVYGDDLAEGLLRCARASEIASEGRTLEWVLSMREKLTLDVLQAIERRLEELEYPRAPEVQARGGGMAGQMSESLLPCAKCGEDAILVHLDGLYYVRVRRLTKCKRYKAGHSATTCQTGIRKTEEEAVVEWNREHGKDYGTDRCHEALISS